MPPAAFYIRSMPKQVPIGARGEARECVEHKHTLTAHDKRLPALYSTPDMIRLMETAGFRALHPYCEEGEITVGTAIDIEHRAGCGIARPFRPPRSWSRSMAGFTFFAYTQRQAAKRLVVEP